MTINPEALAAFVVADDANTIMEGLRKLSPEIRASYVNHLVLISGAKVEPQSQTGITGETRETRCIERRLMGETITEISVAEQMTWKEVQDVLRKAKAEGGLDIKIHDGAKPKVAPKAVKKVEPKEPQAPKIVRRQHPQDILDTIVDLRLQSIGPSEIASRLKRDKDYDITQPTLWRVLAKEEQKRGLTYPVLNKAPEPAQEAQLLEFEELRHQAVQG